MNSVFNNIKNSYSLNPYKENFYFFEEDSLSIPFKKDAKRILIWVSGGADSALLTHLICDHITKNSLNVDVHVLQFARKWMKAPWQETIGAGVYNYFVNKFTNINFTRHSVMLPTCVEDSIFINKQTKELVDEKTGDNLVSDEYCSYITHKYKIDVNYNATTCNPPVEFNKRVKSRDVICDGSIDNSYRLLGEFFPNSYNCNPFIFIDKSWVVKQYKNRNLLDLLNITRSCESYIKGVDYSNWEGNVDLLEDCNTNCYWCQERNWALEQNGLLKYKNKHGKVNVY